MGVAVGAALVAAALVGGALEETPPTEGPVGLTRFGSADGVARGRGAPNDETDSNCEGGGGDPGHRTVNVPLTARAVSGSTSRRYDPAGRNPGETLPWTHFVETSNFACNG